ncbi:amino acid ABC transporter permease [Halobacillus karajensis]|uniref:Inner membrane amino-acid ABC transporter permease protein YecS n=1 Tax=Halobacillus karajensis TaxID=195088 RepID=A0A024P5B2_9BACI|nr:amino acid ABC transporter permease [Halobacillus karajensis]CDQ20466.1 Inner membrane amino-acid ABC transporter permease protein YecS [Halobacillus karajensis]CDQ24065.1 Inner membrane amino-acid ABC transporter permease protein YecS [Halobacillus karajensis]CDQ27543.1 Inner membrane amino-acid ABC transporter permease protein YecS [Halobacillus karajensis]
MFGIEVNNIQIEKIFNAENAWENLSFILEGVPYTLLVALSGMAIGLVLGFFIALARGSNHRWLRWTARSYISFMRGTPILVYLFVLYFGLPVVGIQISAISAAILGFGTNSAAYIAEINRSSLNSVSNGQWESSRALGFTYWQTIRRIIMPQATRIAIPPLGNVFLDLLKATSLAAMISVPEILNKAQIAAGRTVDSMTMYITAALVYWPLTMIFSALQDYLEKRHNRYL